MEQSRPVRIGPITLFTLVAVICLATFAVLSITTANASYNLARLQADSMEQQYQAEAAAQDFVARVDTARGGATDIAATLPAIVTATAEQADGIEVSAEFAGTSITASFACENGRVLNVELELGEANTYRIVKWNMVAKENVAETETLWSGM